MITYDSITHNPRSPLPRKPFAVLVPPNVQPSTHHLPRSAGIDFDPSPDSWYDPVKETETALSTANQSLLSASDIILATANARYSHTAFGLRWLWANLGALQKRTSLREFTLRQPPAEIAEALLTHSPRLIGLSIYIWNVNLLTHTARIIKAIRPEIALVVGGPEASYEYEDTELFRTCDFLVRGEGEESFRQLAQAILDGQRPLEKVVEPKLPLDLSELQLPYDGYSNEDIEKRTIYVESSRGCPYKCTFCLSSLDKGVRTFPLDPFLSAMDSLLMRGARHFRFVDRTFNLDRGRVEAIFAFFHDRWVEGMQLHFEIMPDRLTPSMLAWIARFPAGGLHLEVGVQTFNPETLAAVSRKQDIQKTIEILGRLRQETGALLHADLIAGLPGESLSSFARGFDRLLALAPHEIQVGILKRLRGTALAQYAGPHTLVFSPEPPYDVLETNLIPFEDMQSMKRFARYFDLYYNSGNFPASLELLWATRPSAFDAFMTFSENLWSTAKRTHELSLARQARLLYAFLVREEVAERAAIAGAVERDFRRVPGRKDRLELPV
jgi:radical SAM superfamily enzyme YgiQ (UPF0313 family)